MLDASAQPQSNPKNHMWNPCSQEVYEDHICAPVLKLQHELAQAQIKSSIQNTTGMQNTTSMQNITGMQNTGMQNPTSMTNHI